MATPPKSPNPTDKHVGARVKMRRLMLGMSKETLGNSLGVSLQQVQKYEDGANRISASRLQHLARVLRVPESFFFEGGPNASSAVPDMPSYITAFITNRDGIALARAFMSIRDGELRRCITRLVEEIAKGQ